MSVDIGCDNCGMYIKDSRENTYCEGCWTKLKDKVVVLEDVIKELEKQLEEVGK